MKPSLAFALAIFAAGNTALFAEPNWPRFAGADGSSHSTETDLPVKWDAGGIAWKTKLKGEGQSAVVNWGDRLFVTSATENGTKRWVHCLDRKTGKLLWEREVPCAKPEVNHKMNTWATPTCVTDGERVIAFFGPGGIHCFDLDGKPQWSRDLGTFPGDWGIGASPIIDGNLVIQNCDAEGPSSLVALDKTTGKTVWTAKRPDAPKGGWSTPVIIKAGGRRELLLNGEFGVNAYDPATGRDLWFCKGFTGRGTPMPAFANGQIYVVNGKPGNTYVVKPGGSGDVSETHRVWDAKRVGGCGGMSPRGLRIREA
jgi:outer membrane protein assembly factor BamB